MVIWITKCSYLCYYRNGKKLYSKKLFFCGKVDIFTQLPICIPLHAFPWRWDSKYSPPSLIPQLLKTTTMETLSFQPCLTATPAKTTVPPSTFPSVTGEPRRRANAVVVETSPKTPFRFWGTGCMSIASTHIPQKWKSWACRDKPTCLCHRWEQTLCIFVWWVPVKVHEFTKNKILTFIYRNVVPYLYDFLQENIKDEKCFMSWKSMGPVLFVNLSQTLPVRTARINCNVDFIPKCF